MSQDDAHTQRALGLAWSQHISNLAGWGMSEPPCSHMRASWELRTPFVPCCGTAVTEHCMTIFLNLDEYL